MVNVFVVALVFVALLGMSGVVSAGFCETSTIKYCSAYGCTLNEVIGLYYSCMHPMQYVIEGVEVIAN